MINNLLVRLAKIFAVSVGGIIIMVGLGLGGDTQTVTGI